MPIGHGHRNGRPAFRGHQFVGGVQFIGQVFEQRLEFLDRDIGRGTQGGDAEAQVQLAVPVFLGLGLGDAQGQGGGGERQKKRIMVFPWSGGPKAAR
jgi:hypothetical protein